MKMSLTILLTLTLTLTACDAFFSQTDSECVEGTISDSMIITPPAGATIIEQNCYESFQPQARMEYVFPPEVIDDLAIEIGIDAWEDQVPDDLDPNLLPVNPEPFESYLYSYFGNGIESTYVIVDTSNLEEYRAYIVSTFVD